MDVEAQDRTQAEMRGGMNGPRNERTRWVGKGPEICCLWRG